MASRRPPRRPGRRILFSGVAALAALSMVLPACSPSTDPGGPMGPGSKAIFEERMLGAEVQMKQNLAQVWARYEARFGDPGEVVTWQGIDAFTLMRHDGRWRIVAVAFTGDE